MSRLKIAIVSAGSPELFTEKLHVAGITFIHVVSSVKQALKAKNAGADAIVCIGYEAGGNLGSDELTTFILFPQIADAIDIPFAAGDGIADGRGAIAAMALGADGIYVGKRFVAIVECRAHAAVKQAIVNAEDTDTIAFARRTGISRCLKNEYTSKHVQMEASGASFDEIRAYERSCEELNGWRRMPAAFIDGNLQYGSCACGAVAALIKDIIPAGEVVRRIVQEYGRTKDML